MGSGFEVLNCRSKTTAAKTNTFFVHCLGRIVFMRALIMVLNIA